jgi:hypothetical protein
MGCARLLLYVVLIFAAILLPVGARAESRLALIITNAGYPSEIGTLANPARFVVVDACRDVAFTKGIKDAAKGLVPERKLEGMIVTFATRSGETADDNNVYASALASCTPQGFELRRFSRRRS